MARGTHVNPIKSFLKATLELSMRDAMQRVKRLGIGSAEQLQGVNLAASASN
jgi:hypothetical protein